MCLFGVFSNCDHALIIGGILLLLFSGVSGTELEFAVLTDTWILAWGEWQTARLSTTLKMQGIVDVGRLVWCTRMPFMDQTSFFMGKIIGCTRLTSVLRHFTPGSPIISSHLPGDSRP